MNYNRISVYSHCDFDEKMYRLGLDSDNVGEEDDKAFISIVGTPECQKYHIEEEEKHWFDGKSENVLNLEFDDVTEETIEWKGHIFKGITEGQAEQIARFIDKHKGKNFYCHCRAGKSRSNAVGLAIYDLLGEEYGYDRKTSFRKDNPPNTPNIFVLSAIKRAYYKLKGLEIE